MKRILCVWLPRWPIQRFRHAQPALIEAAWASRRVYPGGLGRTVGMNPAARALVLFAPARGKMVVTACSPGAARCGVVPGMPLAEAKALGMDAHFASHEPGADHEALRKLAVWCQR